MAPYLIYSRTEEHLAAILDVSLSPVTPPSPMSMSDLTQMAIMQQDSETDGSIKVFQIIVCWRLKKSPCLLPWSLNPFHVAFRGRLHLAYGFLKDGICLSLSRFVGSERHG